MSEVTIALLVIGGLAVLGLTFYLHHKAHQKKVAELTAYAARRGWHYTERDRSLTDRFVGRPFGGGHGRDAKHVLSGEYRGRQVLIFEYSYKETTGSGDDRRTETYRHTVVSAGTPAPRPTLELTRETFGRKLLGFVGVRDLQLESEQFNDTFRISTEDDKFAYDILHPRMMEWLLADNRAMRLPFRFERADLVVWDSDQLDPANLGWMVDFVCDVLDRVPGFVWKP